MNWKPFRGRINWINRLRSPYWREGKSRRGAHLLYLLLQWWNLKGNRPRAWSAAALDRDLRHRRPHPRPPPPPPSPRSSASAAVAADAALAASLSPSIESVATVVAVAVGGGEYAVRQIVDEARGRRYGAEGRRQRRDAMRTTYGWQFQRLTINRKFLLKKLNKPIF